MIAPTAWSPGSRRPSEPWSGSSAARGSGSRWPSSTSGRRRSAGPGAGVGLLRAAAWIFEEALHNRERADRRAGEAAGAEPRGSRGADPPGPVSRGGRAGARTCGQVLENWAGVTEDDRERIELSRRIGELLEGPLRKVEQAVEVYQGILAAGPSDRPTLERLKAIFERTGRWSRPRHLPAEGAGGDHGGAGERAPAGADRADLCQDKLGDLEAAQMAFEEALEADPNLTPGPARPAGPAARPGRLGTLVELYSATGGSDPRRRSGRLARYARAGEICEEQLQGHRAAPSSSTTGPWSSTRATGRPARPGAALSRRPWTAAHWSRTTCARPRGRANPLQRLRAYLRLGGLFDGPGTTCGRPRPTSRRCR